MDKSIIDQFARGVAEGAFGIEHLEDIFEDDYVKAIMEAAEAIKGVSDSPDEIELF